MSLLFLQMMHDDDSIQSAREGTTHLVAQNTFSKSVQMFNLFISSSNNAHETSICRK